MSTARRDRGAGSWLLDRSGLRAMLASQAKIGGKLIPANLSWLYTTGALALFFFALQFLTGALLMTIYVPHEEQAFASVQTIQHKAELGWLVRQMHSWGASFVIIVLILHILKVLWFGSYKRPREFTWFVGVILLNIALGFCFSGYLLPWNELSFWATRVALEAIDSIPVVGIPLKEFICGESAIPGIEPGDAIRSPNVSGATIGRFFSLHVVILPMTLLAFVGYHLFLITFKGASPKTTVREELAIGHRDALVLHGAETFFPRQVYRDLIACTLGFAALVTVSTLWPWEIGEPASLTTPPGIKPEWYFLPMYQFVKYFDNKLWAIVWMGGAGAAFFLLPLIDRGSERKMVKRPILFWLGPVFVAGIAAFLALRGADILAWIGAESWSAAIVVGASIAVFVLLAGTATAVFAIGSRRPLFASLSMLALLALAGLGALGYLAEHEVRIFGTTYHFDTYGVPTVLAEPASGEDGASAGVEDGDGAEPEPEPEPKAEAEIETDAGADADAGENAGGGDTAAAFLPRERGGNCITCHERPHEEWTDSVHQRIGVACADCHGGNPGALPDPIPLFLAKPPIAPPPPAPEPSEKSEDTDTDAKETEPGESDEPEVQGDAEPAQPQERDDAEPAQPQERDDAEPAPPVITYLDPCEILDEIPLDEWPLWAFAHIGLMQNDDGCPTAPKRADIPTFCGSACHERELGYFREGRELHEEGRPRKSCASCHSNHSVQPAGDALWENYDDEDDPRTGLFREIRALLTSVDERIAAMSARPKSERSTPLRPIESLLAESYPAAEFVAKLDKLANEAEQLRARVHTLDPDRVRGSDADRGSVAIHADLDALAAAIDVHVHAPDDRWVFIAGVWGAAALSVLFLGWKLRSYPKPGPGEVSAPEIAVSDSPGDEASGSADDDAESRRRASIASREAEDLARHGDERGALLHPLESDGDDAGEES